MPRAIRLQRVQDRSNKLFGERSCEGGKFYEQIKPFQTFCDLRDKQMMENGLSNISCPIILIDGRLPIDINVTFVDDKLLGGSIEMLEKDWLFYSDEYICDLRTVGVLVKNNRVLV